MADKCCEPTGVDIESTYKDGGYAKLDGTSMAAPHAAGILLRSGAIADGGPALRSGEPDGIIEQIGVVGP